MPAPLVLAGKPLPLRDLSPDEFQEFVFVALQVLAPRLGFRVGHLTGRSGDGGFDTDGTRAADGAVVCVQVKRYTSTELSIPQVAAELAKVALGTSLKGGVPKEHHLITSGKVRSVLYEALREPDRKTLIAKAIEVGLADDELKALRSEVSSKGYGVEATIAGYVRQLDVLPVLSATEFDRLLGLVWSQLGDAIGRHFTIERVLVEHPRPDFDEASYLRGLPRVDAQPLLVSPAKLPANVRLASSADPFASTDSDKIGRRPPTTAGPPVDAVTACLGIGSGEVLLLLGPGGAGKSTVLQMVLGKAAERRRDDADAALPVLINLGAYRGSLRPLVEDELGVRGGHWESLLGPVLLLCDGLNELGPKDAAAVVDELGHVVKRGRVAVVVTMRATGSSAPIVFPRVSVVLQLQPFTFRDVRRLAGQRLEGAAAVTFVSEYRARFNFAGGSLFALPFGVAMLLRSFASTGRLARNTRELMEDVFRRRFETNDEILSRREARARLPRSTLQGLAGVVAEDLRLVRGRTLATRGEVEAAVLAGVSAMRRTGVFGAEGLQDDRALEALFAYEVLFAVKQDFYRFEHEIVAGYLVSAKLGREWRSYTHLLIERTLDEAWLLAANDVADAEREAFFKALCEVDLVLAAQAALQCEGALPIVESIVLSRFAAGSKSVVARSETFTAMAIIASQACIASLRALALSAARRTDEHDRAMRALCVAGDRETLAAVLLEADKMQSMPGIRVSGGEVSWWDLAPAHVALALARARIVDPATQYLSASLWTVGRYGDSSDVPALLKVIEMADVYAARRAYHVTAEFDEKAARDALLAKTRSLPPSERMAALFALGATREDAEWLLDVVLEARTEEAATGDDPFAVQNALKLLASIDLPEGVRRRVREAYEGADQRTRESLWSIAANHKLASFEALAVEAVRAENSNEAGWAANFAVAHSWQDAGLQTQFHTLAKAAVESDWFAYVWDGWRLLVYLLSVGERAVVAHALKRQLGALVEASQQHRRGARPQLMRRGVDLLAREEDRHVKHTISGMVASVLVEAANVADLLPNELALGLLGVPLSMHATRTELIRLVGDLDPASIDAALRGIDDEIHRTETACLLSQLGATDTRVAIIVDGFACFLSVPAILSQLIAAAELLWSDAMLERVVEAIVRGWPDEGWVDESSLAELGRLVTRAQAQNIVAPALSRTRTSGAHRMLEFWCEAAQKRRGGA